MRSKVIRELDCSRVDLCKRLEWNTGIARDYRHLAFIIWSIIGDWFVLAHGFLSLPEFTRDCFL